MTDQTETWRVIYLNDAGEPICLNVYKPASWEWSDTEDVTEAFGVSEADAVIVVLAPDDIIYDNLGEEIPNEHLDTAVAEPVTDPDGGEDISHPTNESGPATA